MRTLRWVQPSAWSWRWSLRDGERDLATLAPSGLAFARADVSTASRAWRIESRGLFRWRLVLVREDGAEVATLPLDWRGAGTIERADGRAFEWRPESWWASRFSLRAGDRTIARVTGDSWFRLGATVEVLDDALGDEELVPLLALAWFATVLMTMGGAAVVTG